MQGKIFPSLSSILVFMLCFSTIVMADRTYLEQTFFNKWEIEFYKTGIDLDIFKENYVTGIITGCIQGNFTSDNVVWLEIGSGSKMYYGFTVGNFSSTVQGQPIQVDLATVRIVDQSGTFQSYGAFFKEGQIGGIGSKFDFELTSLFGTQYSGNFQVLIIEENEEDYDGVIPLTVYGFSSLWSIKQSDISKYSGQIEFLGEILHLDVSELEAFQDLGITEVSIYTGTYNWDGTPDIDGLLYLVSTNQSVLGALTGEYTGEIKGLFYADLDFENVFIEHAGTAPLIPIPSTLLLLGSGLIGILAIKRRNLG